MKKFIVFAVAILAYGSSIAQNTNSQQKPMTPAQKKAADLRKNAVGGYVRDARNRPFEGAQAFIYQADSANSIIASGYSDATGYYETNSVLPGKYTIKIVYPSNKALIVTEVIMKRGITDISPKMDAPSADSTLPFTIFKPRPPVKGKAK
jgi:hypothetical protein